MLALGWSYRRIENGQRYPLALAGPEIPLEGRILRMADSLDAIWSPRPYRNKHEPRTGLEAHHELLQARGKAYDPQLVDAVWRSLLALHSVPAAPEGVSEPTRSERFSASPTVA